MPAEDPVIEIMQHSSKRGGNVRDQTPVGAWILVNIILIHMLKKQSKSSRTNVQRKHRSSPQRD